MPNAYGYETTTHGMTFHQWSITFDTKVDVRIAHGVLSVTSGSSTCACRVAGPVDLEGSGSEIPQPRAAMVEDPDLRLDCDGHIMRPVRQDAGKYEFLIPTKAAGIRLLSRSAVPSVPRPWIADMRRLGVMVKGLTSRGGRADHGDPDG